DHAAESSGRGHKYACVPGSPQNAGAAVVLSRPHTYWYATSLRPRPAWFANRQTRTNLWPRPLAVRYPPSAGLRGCAFVSLAGAAQPHQAGDLLQKLLRRAELLRRAGGPSHPPELVRIGSRQPGDDGGIRAQRDRVAG